MYMQGNKQEWSKIYALFKLLTTQEIFGGDIGLEKDNREPLKVIRVERTTPDAEIRYKPDGDKIICYIGETDRFIDIAKLKEALAILSKKLIRDEEVFEDSYIEGVLEEMGIFDFYSSSEDGDDFRAVFFNPETECEAYFPIRIKSL